LPARFLGRAARDLRHVARIELVQADVLIRSDRRRLLIGRHRRWLGELVGGRLAALPARPAHRGRGLRAARHRNSWRPRVGHAQHALGRAVGFDLEADVRRSDREGRLGEIARAGG
jgi:hypothetical protein